MSSKFEHGGRENVQALRSVQEASQILGLSGWTIRRWVQQGRIRPIRLGSRVLFEESELQRVIDEGKKRDHTTPTVSESPLGRSYGHR